MTSPLTRASYDFIICGGGTAGCVLAARLTELADQHVLVLEAGDDARGDARVTTPGLFSTLLEDAARDWQYRSEPAAGLGGRAVALPRGRCLGGSAAVNVMGTCFPSRAGLDAWAGALRNGAGWSWDGMRAYFRRATAAVPLPDDEVREALGIDYLGLGPEESLLGTGGPIKASFPQAPDPLQRAWVRAWEALRKRGNPVDGVAVGGFTSPSTIDVATGRRSFAGLDYYAPAAERPNLHVVTGAMVERIELDASVPGAVRATGVTFSVGEARFTASASREVLLCGGALASPQILELSGIGDAKVCREFGVKSVIDNPNVGENLQDHLMCSISYEVADGVNTVDMIRDPAVAQAAMQQYEETHSGPLAANGGYSFAYTPLVDFLTGEPQEALTALLDQHLPPAAPPKFPSEAPQYAFLRRVVESPSETSGVMFLIPVQFHGGLASSKQSFAISAPGNYISIFAQLAHPFSRGSVHIRSARVRDHPRIAANYLAHPLDAELLGRHLLQVEALAATAPIQALLKPGGRRLPANWKGHEETGAESKVQAPMLRTLEDAVAFARAYAVSNYHLCGTCAMMPAAMGGVVDAELRVHGTTNLRVVDASIFPLIPRGLIQTSVYAVAEKAADLIKESLKS